MTTTTLDKFDFSTVFKYLDELSRHVHKESNKEIDIITLVIAPGDDVGTAQMGIMSTDRKNTKDLLIRALILVFKDERDGTEFDIKDLLKKLMES